MKPLSLITRLLRYNRKRLLPAMVAQERTFCNATLQPGSFSGTSSSATMIFESGQERWRNPEPKGKGEKTKRR
jgi:hypothetical protein